MKKVLKTYLHLFVKNYPPNINNKLSMYFLRNSSGMVPVPNTLDEADVVLTPYFDYGLLNSHPLYMLNQVLTKVYTPLLSYRERPEDHLMGQMKAITNGENKTEETQYQNKADDEKEMRVRTKGKKKFI